MKVSRSGRAPLVPRNSERRGVLAAWMIWMVPVAGVLMAGLLNLVWMSSLRNHAKNYAASAAIAAGHSYLSDDILRNWQQPFEYEGRAARCRRAAVALTDRYRVGTRLPPVSEGQVTLEWNDEGKVESDPAMLVPAGISVSIIDPAVHSFFPKLYGSDFVGLNVVSGVSLEHSPMGFRPSSTASIPILPFAISDGPAEVESELSGVLSGYWTTSVESRGGQDRFSWNPEGRLFENGPDGLSEITVTLHDSTSETREDSFLPYAFAGGQNDPENGWESWVREGLTLRGLESLGKREIVFPGDMPTAQLSAAQLGGVAEALRSKIGQPCIIGLSSQRPEVATGGTLNLRRPVAARVVQVLPGEMNSVVVVLQPCVIVTATALTSPRPHEARNRYIYSIRICH